MKKKILCTLLICTMAILTACGASDDSSKSESSENSSVDADADTYVEDGTDEDEEKSEEESSELNEYGLTAGQQEALLASVQASVTEGYLEKYNIPAADFKLLPYDANDLNNYDSSGQYTGEDPYECAAVWQQVDNTILWSSDFEFFMNTAIAASEEKEWIVEYLSEKDFTLADTLEEQNQKNSEAGTASYVLDTSTEHYDLTNAVYMGIAKFLNQLDEQERIGVLYELYVISDKNSESIVLNNSGQEVRSTTMFDKVISENIQFE